MAYFNLICEGCGEYTAAQWRIQENIGRVGIVGGWQLGIGFDWNTHPRLEADMGGSILRTRWASGIVAVRSVEMGRLTTEFGLDNYELYCTI
jgi:hypothetical protein